MNDSAIIHKILFISYKEDELLSSCQIHHLYKGMMQNDMYAIQIHHLYKGRLNYYPPPRIHHLYKDDERIHVTIR